VVCPGFVNERGGLGRIPKPPNARSLVAKLPQLPEPKSKGLWGRSPQRWEIFCNFSMKITHFHAYFTENSYFEVITHQLKAFKTSLNVLNRINEEQILLFL